MTNRNHFYLYNFLNNNNTPFKKETSFKFIAIKCVFNKHSKIWLTLLKFFSTYQKLPNIIKIGITQ